MTLEEILKDPKFWEEVQREEDEKFLQEIEAANKDERFNRCDFQDFLDYVNKLEASEKR